jgi:hypothetical protein
VETVEQVIMAGMEEMEEQVVEVPMAVAEVARAVMVLREGFRVMVGTVVVVEMLILLWLLPEVAAREVRVAML